VACASPAPSEPRLTEAVGSDALDWLVFAAPGVIWGASFLFIAYGLEAIGPYGVTFVRILVGFTTLSLFPAARRPLAHPEGTRIALLAVLWLAFPLSMFPFAEQRVSSAVTGMLNGATPLFAAIVAAGLARRAPAPRVAIGLAVGLLGAVLVAWPLLHEGASSAEGILLILAALISYGFAYNLAPSLQQRYGALPVIWRALGFALALTAPLGLPELAIARFRLGPAMALLALGALGTGIANVLAAVAAGRMGATRASATTFLMPAVALALGVVVRGERVAPLSVLGGATCVAGAWLMRRSRGAPARPRAA
jgi:drug/metabolite transporter (DMT)-like permease